MTGALRGSARMFLLRNVLAKGAQRPLQMDESIIELHDFRIVSYQGSKTVGITAE